MTAGQNRLANTAALASGSVAGGPPSGVCSDAILGGAGGRCDRRRAQCSSPQSLLGTYEASWTPHRHTQLSCQCTVKLLAGLVVCLAPALRGRGSEPLPPSGDSLGVCPLDLEVPARVGVICGRARRSAAGGDLGDVLELACQTGQLTVDIVSGVHGSWGPEGLSQAFGVLLVKPVPGIRGAVFRWAAGAGNGAAQVEDLGVLNLGQ